ncbi:MAG TPA: BTAD domain-containing putative transcriptional regulator [Aquihabitans sp.]|nr:BTAD domain-containing putative transcriptional regulator [Aquihabitans sp.]
MTRYDVTVLGRTQVAEEGQPVPLRPREASVVAALALTSGPTAVDVIVDRIWLDPPATAVKSLHNHVARLRRSVDLVVTAPEGYALASGAAVDLDRFEALVAGVGADPARADALEAALVAWREPAFASLCDSPAVEVERARLAELRARAEEQVVALRLLRGADPALVAAAEALAAADPYREPRWWLLMLARHRAGRRRDALAAFQQAREALVGGAGLEPGASLRALEARILADDPSLGTADPLLGPDGPLPAPAPEHHARPPRPTPLVGRTVELERIVDHAAHGGAGTLVVLGEAGTGKTALGDAAQRLIEGAGIVVVRTAGEPTPEGPLAPVQRLVDHLVATHGEATVRAWVAPDDRAAIGRLAPNVLDEEPLSLPGPVDAAVGRLLAAATRVRPHVVIVDDAHLVPPSSARTLASLPTAAGPPLVLLARPEPLPVPFAELSSATLALDNLDRAGVEAYLAGEVGRALAPEVVEHLHRRSGGNPLLLGAIVSAPAVREALATGADVAVVAGAEHVTETVAAFARQRLGELAAATVRVVEAAAVIGATVDQPTLHAVAGPIDDHLEAAIGAGLLVRDGSAGPLEFRHHLIRDAVLLAISPGTRAELHDAVADALERVADPDRARIAHHRLAIADDQPEAALDACRRAAAEAVDQFAYREAADLLGTVCDLLVRFGRRGTAEHADATIDHGEALHLAGDPAARAILLDAAARAEADGDLDRAGRALLCLCRLGLSTDAGPAEPDLAERIDRVLSGDVRADIAAELAATASLLHSLDPDPRRCRELFDQAERIARDAAPEVLPRVLPYAYLGLAHPDQLDRRAEIAEELVAIAPDGAARFSGLHQRFSVQVQRGDPGFRATHAEMARLAQQMGDPGHRWTVAYNAACVHQLDGDLAAAEAAAEESLAIEGIALSRRIAAYGVQLVALRRAQRRMAELAEEVDRLLRDQPDVKGWRAVAMATAAAAGDLDRVRQLGDALAADGHAGVPDDYTRSGAALLVVEATVATGDRDRIARDLPLLDHLRGRLSWVGTTTLGSIDLVAGRAEAALDDPDAARASFARARSIGRRLGTARLEALATSGLELVAAP